MTDYVVHVKRKRIERENEIMNELVGQRKKEKLERELEELADALNRASHSIPSFFCIREFIKQAILNSRARKARDKK